QAEDGIRDLYVTGVQTCALPISVDAVSVKTGKPQPFALVFHGGSGSLLSEIREALSYGVVKMNVDTDTQYAFTREIAGHMFTNRSEERRVGKECRARGARHPEEK